MKLRGESPEQLCLGKQVLYRMFPPYPGVLVKHLEAELSLGPEGLIAGALLLEVSLKGRGREKVDFWGFACLVLRFLRGN